MQTGGRTQPLRMAGMPNTKAETGRSRRRRGADFACLGCDVCGLPSVGVGMPGLFNEGQALRVSAGREVVFIEHGLPVHAIQVRPADFVPCLLKRLHAHLDEPAVSDVGSGCAYGRSEPSSSLIHSPTVELTGPSPLKDSQWGWCGTSAITDTAGNADPGGYRLTDQRLDRHRYQRCGGRREV